VEVDLNNAMMSIKRCGIYKCPVIRPTPTPSWTVSSITLIASNSPAKACVGPKQSNRGRLDPTPQPVTTIHRPARLATRAASFRYDGRHHSGIPGGIIPLHPGGFVGIGTPSQPSRPTLPDRIQEPKAGLWSGFGPTLLLPLNDGSRLVDPTDGAVRPWRGSQRRLRSESPSRYSSVGTAFTAFALLIGMPELGMLDAAQAASLAGLAPVARQSGSWTGRDFIRAGRSAVRRALYKPALVATRFNPDMKTTYKGLIAAGKPAKVAITAVMRKLLILANALLKANRTWIAKPLTKTDTTRKTDEENF
jgi:hypothetical protein